MLCTKYQWFFFSFIFHIYYSISTYDRIMATTDWRELLLISPSKSCINSLNLQPNDSKVTWWRVSHPWKRLCLTVSTVSYEGVLRKRLAHIYCFLHLFFYFFNIVPCTVNFWYFLQILRYFQNKYKNLIRCPMFLPSAYHLGLSGPNGSKCLIFTFGL